jgi:hypothetical protein
LPHLVDHPERCADGEPIRFRRQIILREVLELAVHRHQVLRGPLARGTVCKCDVVGRRELPGIPPPQPIVIVARHDLTAEGCMRQPALAHAAT